MESKFYCEKCNYRTDIASCYKQHLETTLHKTGKRKERCDKTLYKCNKKFKYYCDCCDFGVFVKSMMDTHLNTTKHQLKFNDSININI
jgi:hypothetical protein